MDTFIGFIFILALILVIGMVIKLTVEEKRDRAERLTLASTILRENNERREREREALLKRKDAIARQAVARDAVKDPSALNDAVAKARAQNPQRMQRPAQTRVRPTTVSSPRASQTIPRKTASGATEYGYWENGIWLPVVFASGGYTETNPGTPSAPDTTDYSSGFSSGSSSSDSSSSSSYDSGSSSSDSGFSGGDSGSF